MRLRCAGLLAAVCCQVWHVAAIYLPLREYAGTTFFDGWDYWGDIDNTTWGEHIFSAGMPGGTHTLTGNVTYLDRTNATTTRLTYVNDAGHAIIRVDNTTTIADATLVHRDSVRIKSKLPCALG
jgi:hypothetical protein